MWNPAGRVTARGALPGHSTSRATAVNRRGAAVGSSDETGNDRAIRWDRFGNATELPGPAGVRLTIATDIADDGTAVGYSEDAWPPIHHALRCDRFGNATELGTLPDTLGSKPIAINNRRMVIGTAHGGNIDPRGILWR